MASNRLLFPFLTLALGLAVHVGAEVEPPVDPRPDFTGTWELDAERSDDVEEKLKEAARDARASSQSRGRRPTRPVRPLTGTWSNPGAAGDDAADPDRAVGDLEHGLRILAIEHEEPQMRISSGMPGSTYAQVIYSDGRVFDRLILDGSRVPAKAEWKRGGRLLVEYEGLGERPVEETWELVADGSRILVTTRVAAKSLQPALRLNRVYDRVEIVPWDVPE